MSGRAPWSAAVAVCLLLAISVLALPTAQGQLRWEKISTGKGPVARKDFAAAWDRESNSVLVFGGKTSDGIVDETWIFNVTSGSWTRVETQVQPEPRFSVVSAVHASSRRAIVSTGEGNGKRFFNDVWAFSFASRTWEKLADNGAPNAPRRLYGASGGLPGDGSDAFWVTHGFDGGARFHDTHVFDVVTRVWTDRTPTVGALPHERCLHSGTVLQDGTVLIFGGCGSGGYGRCPAQDSWALDATSDRWVSLPECPAPRFLSAMAPAPWSTSAAVLFGGSSSVFAGDSAGEVHWIDMADARSWTPTVPAAVSEADGVPAQRVGAQLVRTDSGLLLVGGSATASDSLEPWRLTGSPSEATDVAGECREAVDLRVIHGVFMVLGWGILLPIGVMVARFLKYKPNALWFRLHRTIQPVGLLVALVGFVLAILSVGAGHFLAAPHAYIGALVMFLGILQPVNAYFRPHVEPGVEKSAWRVRWEYLHKYSGRVAVVLGVINPFQGLVYLKAHPVLFVFYSLWVAFVAGVHVYMTFWLGEPEVSPLAQKAVGCLGRTPAWQRRKKEGEGKEPDDVATAKAVEQK